MTFISVEFCWFLAVVLAVYFWLPARPQNGFLLLASWVFYGWWDYRFLVLMLATALTDWVVALQICKKRNSDRPAHVRRRWLYLSLGANLGTLAFFKYWDFFAASVADGLGRLGVSAHPATLGLILPVGISFYTFQSISYTVDVYRGRLRAEEDALRFFTFVGMFPQLVAGPIERATNLLPQIAKRRVFDAERIHSGAQLAAMGVFKKVVVADNLALIVNDVFRQPAPTGPVVLLALYAFAFQIYCDFSGYTDIARGVARALGFDLALNFRLPYFASNPSDFWNRWHISLSTWLRDYLYAALGGFKKRGARTYVALFVTMTLAGLWHGAAWHFVAWGAFYGALLVGYHFAEAHGLVKKRKDAPRALHAARVLLFFHVTLLGWLLFRATDLAQVGTFARALVERPTWRGFPWDAAWQLAVLVVPLLALEALEARGNELEPWRRWPAPARTAFYLVIFYGVVLLGVEHTNAFIYFQF